MPFAAVQAAANLLHDDAGGRHCCASAGGLILGRASSAVAATPKSGGALKAAGWSSSTADTLDPAKASLSTDYVRCCAFYNRLTFLDGAGIAADGTRRKHQEQRRQGLDRQATQGRYLP